MNKTSRAFLKALSSVTADISAAWFALALVSPPLTDFSSIDSILVLTRNILLGILFLVITTIIERYLDQ